MRRLDLSALALLFPSSPLLYGGELDAVLSLPKERG
jgi:hypothetical protein